MLAALSACATAPTPATQSSSNEVAIRIGRLGVILDQGYSAKSTLAPEPFSPLNDTTGEAGEADALKAQYTALYQTVLGHASLQADVCARGLVTPDLCADRFLPPWLVAPARAHVTAAALDAWSDEAQGAMLPLWDALCGKAVAKTGNHEFCAIE